MSQSEQLYYLEVDYDYDCKADTIRFRRYSAALMSTDYYENSIISNHIEEDSMVVMWL